MWGEVLVQLGAAVGAGLVGSVRKPHAGRPRVNTTVCSHTLHLWVLVLCCTFFILGSTVPSSCRLHPGSQLRVLLGSYDQLPPGDLKFLIVSGADPSLLDAPRCQHPTVGYAACSSAASLSFECPPTPPAQVMRKVAAIWAPGEWAVDTKSGPSCTACLRSGSCGMAALQATSRWASVNSPRRHSTPAPLPPQVEDAHEALLQVGAAVRHPRSVLWHCWTCWNGCSTRGNRTSWPLCADAACRCPGVVLTVPACRLNRCCPAAAGAVRTGEAGSLGAHAGGTAGHAAIRAERHGLTCRACARGQGAVNGAGAVGAWMQPPAAVVSRWMGSTSRAHLRLASLFRLYFKLSCNTVRCPSSG